MVSVPGRQPPYDTANPLFGPTPSRIDCASARPPGDGAEQGMVTIRTASTTLTVLLSTDELRTWAGLLAGLADTMDSPGLARANPADVIALNRHPPR